MPELGFDQVLEQAGYRSTRQRRAVYEHLEAMHGHPTAEDVFHAVREELPRISLATVYKALESLVESGVAQKMTVGDGTAHFESRVDEHFHARCRACNRIVDVEAMPEFHHCVEKVRTQGFAIERARVELTGLCEACARQHHN
jgi:Fe2+ or Zn2+ uptake regulation protein